MTDKTPRIPQHFMNWLEVPEARQRPFLLHMAIFLGLVVLILYVDPSSFNPEVIEGTLLRKPIICPRNITFVDDRKTEEMRRQEEEKVEPVVTPLDHAEQDQMAKFDLFQERLSALYADWKEKDTSDWNETLIASYFPKDRLLDMDTLKEAVTLSRTDFDRVKTTARKILANFTQRTITARNLETMKNSVGKEIRLPNEWTSKIAGDLVRNCLIINAIEDEKQTRQARETARESVRPVVRSYQKGQKIVDQGVIITADDIYVLRAIEKQIQKNRLLSLFGNILLSTLIIGTLLAHLRLTRHSLLRDFPQFRLMGGLLIGTLILSKVVFYFSSAFDHPGLAILLAPMPAAGLLTAILIDSQVALFHQMLLGILLFAITEANARFAIVSLISGVLGILFWIGAGGKANLRGAVGWTGFKIGIINAIALNALMMLDVESASIYGLQEIGMAIGYGMGNGILTGILVNGMLPYLEGVFALATGSRLLELADLSQPLLKRLAAEAPGTYQHCLMVAALAEAAATEIHADALLAKIGGYFHDIGKLKRPSYFAENQDGKNQHDHLTPYMSSLILVGHIRDGIDLAREYGLPNSVTAIISQHHGTTLISYFYEQARNDAGSEISEERFRYPGPKPQTKESAIVMLADSVEAASRTLTTHKQANVETLVDKIIRNKLNDESQLDESDLTLKDIEIVQQSFVKVITSMYHGRVDYPGKLSNQPKGAADGSSHQQPPKET